MGKCRSDAGYFLCWSNRASGFLLLPVTIVHVGSRSKQVVEVSKQAGTAAVVNIQHTSSPLIGRQRVGTAKLLVGIGHYGHLHKRLQDPTAALSVLDICISPIMGYLN